MPCWQRLQSISKPGIDWIHPQPKALTQHRDTRDVIPSLCCTQRAWHRWATSNLRQAKTCETHGSSLSLITRNVVCGCEWWWPPLVIKLKRLDPNSGVLWQRLDKSTTFRLGIQVKPVKPSNIRHKTFLPDNPSLPEVEARWFGAADIPLSGHLSTKRLIGGDG